MITCEDDIVACDGDELLGVFMHWWFGFEATTSAKLTVYDGRRWLAMSREDLRTKHQPWGKKRTISRATFDRMLAKGKKLGVLATCQRPSRYAGYKSVLHVAPTDAYMARRREAAESRLRVECEPVESRVRVGREPVESRVRNSDHNQDRDHDRDSEQGWRASANASDTPVSGQTSTGVVLQLVTNPEGHGGPKHMANADDVAAKFKPLNPPKNWAATLKPDNGHQLKKLWQTECAARDVKAMNVTNAQMAQLKAVAKIGGGPDFIARIVRQWDEFTLHAIDIGAFNPPAQPSISFMQKYVNAGFKLTDEPVEKVIMPTQAAKPITPPSKPVAPSKKHKAATPEEMAAIDAEIEAEYAKQKGAA